MKNRPAAEEGMDGNAWHVSIEALFWQCVVGQKRKKAVYWLSTLGVSLKCNHNPNWPYLLYIQAAPGVAGALLFINI